MNGANVMQRLAVEMLCNQLDNTWEYFTATFKMQDHLYVQYVELYQFNNQFGELARKLRLAEEAIEKITGHRIKIVEKAGTMLKRVLHKSNPWAGGPCGRPDCLVYSHEKGVVIA